MAQRVEADFAVGCQQQLLRVRRAGLHDHLVLVVVLQPVGVFAVAAVGRAAAGLHVGGAPGLGPERAQRGGGVEGAGAHLDVVGLQDDAALPRPEAVQAQNEVLEAGCGRVIVRPVEAVWRADYAFGCRVASADGFSEFPGVACEAVGSAAPACPFSSSSIFNTKEDGGPLRAAENGALRGGRSH